jgi:ribose/xylose/arabinose/galactoside ABC-type transport system permease subunit
MPSQDGASKVLAFFGERWATFFLLILLIAFSIVGRNFFSVKNFSNILYFATTYALLAAGETFVIVTGGIDLSVGFVMGLVGVTASIVMRDMLAAGNSDAVCMVVGVLVGLAVGILPGLVNGFLVARLRVPPFIATLGMYGVANGLALNFSQGFPVMDLPIKVQQIGNSFIAYLLPGKAFSFFERPPDLKPTDIRNLIGIVPGTVLVAAIILLVSAFLLKRTRFGQHTYAIGGSKDAAIRSGINVPSHLIWIYVLSSVLASLAGIIYVFRIGIGNFTTFNSSYELFAIAGVVIGGASLMGGRGTLGGALIGVLILNTLENGLNIVGIQAFYRYIATGLILIAAVIIDQFTAERRSNSA